MERIKCITFDKAAQENLPQHIKDKMKANMEKASKEQVIKLCPDCKNKLTAFPFPKGEMFCEKCEKVK